MALPASQIQSKHTLPDLPYDYKALEPTISGQIMELHHKKHHQTYVNNYNAAEEKLLDAANKCKFSQSFFLCYCVAFTACPNTIISLQGALKFNGGGHINHSIFWNNLSPNGGGVPGGDLASQINKDFGSFDNLKTKLSAATVAIQGSGWGWLGWNKESQRLEIATCANQDPLEATTGGKMENLR